MKTTLAVLAAVALAACGTDGSSGIDAQALAEYEGAAAEIATAVDAYEAGAETMATTEDCERVRAGYSGRVNGALDRLTTRARDMDGALASGDAECVAARLRARFEEHVAEGCGLGDIAAARERTAAHCGEMRELANHLRMRCAELSGSGPGDGAGWTDEHGRMYGWDHEVAGCTPPANGDASEGAAGACPGTCDGTGAGPGPGTGECTGDCDGVPDRDRDRDGSCDQSPTPDVSGAA
jgi:hypothetical protein